MGLRDNVDSEAVASAFTLVFVAGGCTGIGASAVFFPSLVQLASKRTLAASLGLSAGVMLYVSLVDIYGKATGGFQDAGHEEGRAFILTTICFFLGIFLMMGLNALVGAMFGDHELHDMLEFFDNKDASRGTAGNLSSSNEGTNPNSSYRSHPDEVVGGHHHNHHHHHQHHHHPITEVPPSTKPPFHPSPFVGMSLEEPLDEDPFADLFSEGESDDNGGDGGDWVKRQETTPDSEDDDEIIDEKELRQREALKNMSIVTALAIALHNFPEGLVTFVSYLDDPAVGFVLATGIGIHNIPEGLCVAMPMYYATGNRLRAFLWGILSGASEPFGALVGYFILGSSFSGNTYGVLFGFVAGIMTYLAVDELLPGAHKYDPENKIVTWSFLVGMLAIASSLVLFSA